MGDYKHYIRVNEAMVIIHGFSSAFEQPQDGDILYAESEHRHFHLVFTEPLTNDRGQYRLKWDNGVVERSKAVLDAEWSLQPPQPPTLQEQVDEMKLLLGDLLLFGGV